MATSSVSYSFVNGTTGDGTQVNQNFTDLVNFLNNQVVHKDGSTTMTGALTLPASDPVSANQAARKAYVDTVGNTGIKVFASTAARDAAITSPIDGQFCYVNSGDAAEGLWSYNGSAWRKGPGWNAPWGYVARAAQTSSWSTSAAGGVTIPSLTQSCALVQNRIYRIHASLIFTNTTASAICGFFIRVGGTTIQQWQKEAFNNSNTNLSAMTTYYVATSTATSTIDVQVATQGTATFGAVGNYGSLLLVEDIGPSGAPV